MKNEGQPKPDRLMQLAWGFAPPLVIEAAVRHGMFDLLDKGAKTAEEISSATGVSLRGAAALLNVLVSIDLLRKEGNRYLLAPESAAFLVSSKPAYHGAFFKHISEGLLPDWLKLTEIVRTGQPAAAVNAKEGAQFFAQFVESLFPISYAAATHLGEHLAIKSMPEPISILDVGAGSGVWGIALARQSPKARIHAVDWAEVLDVTRKVVTQQGLADRLTTSAGDFLEADFGKGHQIAVLGHILHSEGPTRSKKLLRKIFEALAPGGTLAIQEFVPNDERTGPPHTLIFAVNMLVNTEEGDTFTFAEMSAWLKEAGYVNPRLLEAPSVSPLVLANKPK